MPLHPVRTTANTAAEHVADHNAYVTEFDTPTHTHAGGGSVWTQTVNETGASFANWTASGGTWASDGTVISQTATGASFKYALYNTDQPMALCGVEADVRIDSGSGNPQLSSLILGTTSGSIEVRVHTTTGANFLVDVEEHNVAVRLAAVNVPGGGGPYGVWATIRVLSTGAAGSVWVNGTFLGTATMGGGGNQSDLRLASYNSTSSFRNIRLWTHSVPWV